MQIQHHDMDLFSACIPISSPKYTCRDLQRTIFLDACLRSRLLMWRCLCRKATILRLSAIFMSSNHEGDYERVKCAPNWDMTISGRYPKRDGLTNDFHAGCDISEAIESVCLSSHCLPVLIS
jgi:hypothetical protein